MKKGQPYNKFYGRRHRIVQKKSILKNRFFRASILILILSISVLYLLFFSPVFQINSIVISGEQKVSKDDVTNLIENEVLSMTTLSRWPMLSEIFISYFFPHRNIFLINTEKTADIILQEFPLIENIEISRGLPSSLFIIVAERTEVAKWCSLCSVSDTEHISEYFLLDNNGVIFEEISGTDFDLSIIKSFDSNKKNLGQRVVEKETLNNVLQIISKLKQNLEIQTILADIVSEQRLNIKTSENWEIYFNLAGDVDWQITELELLLEKEIDSEKRQKLEYIDLRFNRVFYR